VSEKEKKRHSSLVVTGVFNPLGSSHVNCFLNRTSIFSFRAILSRYTRVLGQPCLIASRAEIVLQCLMSNTRLCVICKEPLKGENKKLCEIEKMTPEGYRRARSLVLRALTDTEDQTAWLVCLIAASLQQTSRPDSGLRSNPSLSAPSTPRSPVTEAQTRVRCASRIHNHNT